MANVYVNDDIDYAKWLKNRNLLIFGVGRMGQNVCRKFQKCGYFVAGFVDNSKEKQGGMVEGLPVYSLKEAEALQFESKVVIVLNNIYKNEIRMQLMEESYLPFVCMDQIDFGYSDIQYYDEEYFGWQKEIGRFTAKFDVERFSPYISADDVVLEFGSGTGYLLKELKAKEKTGIEINDSARAYAKSIGIDSVKDMSLLPDSYADVIISTHVLEHVDDPLGILRGLYKKLKPCGRIMFVVPFENADTVYQKNDQNQHLYTWNALHLGNLFKRAGFFVKIVESYCMQWPYGAGNYEKIYEETGRDTLLVMSELFGEFVGMKNIFILAVK